MLCTIHDFSIMFQSCNYPIEILAENPVLSTSLKDSQESGATSSFLSQYGISSSDGAGKRKKKGAFFKRICALCNLQFPKDAITSTVLYKHTIALRRHWDPNLVSKQVSYDSH